MATFKCSQCGQESAFQLEMRTCPNCESAIEPTQLKLMTESAKLEVEAEEDVTDATVRLPRGRTPQDSTMRQPPGGSEIDDETATARLPESPVESAGTAAVPGLAERIAEEGEARIGDSSKTALAVDLGFADIPDHLQTMRIPESAYESAGNSTAIPQRDVAEGEAGSEFRDYKLVAEIGSGSFGTVYRAVQVPLDRSVAVKLLKRVASPPSEEGDTSRRAREMAEAKIREEFLREAQFTGKLEHPNIVPIHDIGIVKQGHQSDRPFYVMKEIKGISWQDVLGEKSRDENLDIFHRVVDAIGFSHSRNILHCDLKPENVMLGEFGEVLVVDWGQAIDVSRPETIRPGGTPAYCSPEMAAYWCQYGKNPNNAFAEKSQIGPRSDVYLLGAILFQVVTGRAPHYGLQGETPADVMARAARNEIRRYTGFENDELLQIALRALRKIDPEIVTVQQLQEELRSYEARKRSIETRDRAFELLEQAHVTRDYDTYQRAKFGFEEAIELWEENPTAHDGLHRTRLNAAQLALDDENFDLGLEMLQQASTNEEVNVRNQLKKGKASRDRRKRLVAILGLAFSAAVIVGMGVAGYLGNEAAKERRAANKAKDDAAIERQAANEAKDAADEAKADLAAETIRANEAIAKADEAEKKLIPLQEEAAELQTKIDAFEPQMAALNAQKTTLEQNLQTQQKEFESKQAEFNSKEAEFTRKQATFQTQLQQEQNRVQAAKEASELLRFKTGVTQIDQVVQRGDFRSARRFLDAQPAEHHDAFEWRRLNRLAHPEVTGSSYFPDDELLEAMVSGDGQKVVTRFADRIEISSTQRSGQAQLTLPRSQVQRVALSHDGSQLAVAHADGRLELLDSKSGESLGSMLQAQSGEITDLKFSPDQQKLVAVGRPDRINRSVGAEHELMFWQRQNGAWQPMQPPRFRGEWAEPTRIEFSEDGQRVVTTSPTAESGKQFALVLEHSSATNSFDWVKPDNVQYLERDVKSGFVHAVFADPQGTQVIASFNQPSLGGVVNQVVIWDVLPTEQAITPVSFSKNAGEEDQRYPRFRPDQVLTVDAQVNVLRRFQNVLVAGDESGKLRYWRIPQAGIESLVLSDSQVFSGHGRPITSLGVSGQGQQLLSMATGPQGEVLLTDVDRYRPDQLQVTLSADPLNDGSSPRAWADAKDNWNLVASDHGRVSVNPKDNPNKPSFGWQVAAWQRHHLTADKLFAQSDDDHFYQYDLVTGNLERVLSFLVGDKPIRRIAFAQQAPWAVLQREGGDNQLELWNLTNQTRRLISYQGLAGLEDIPLLALSDDGQWVAAGRVRFYLWKADGTLIGDAGLEGNTTQPLSSLTFVEGSPHLLIAREGQMRLYDLRAGLGASQTFTVAGMPAPIGQPNVFDARALDGAIHVAIRRVYQDGDSVESGLDLIRLGDQAIPAGLSQIRGGYAGTITPAGELLALQLVEIQAGQGLTGRLVVQDARSGANRGQPKTIRVSGRQSGGQVTDDRDVFGNVDQAPNGDLILRWSSRGRFNTVTVQPSGSLSQLRVIATPTVQQVDWQGDHVLTMDNGRVILWRVDLNNRAVTPAGTLPGNYRLFVPAPDGQRALAVYEGTSAVALVDADTGESLAPVALPEGTVVTAADWHPAGNALVMGTAAGQLYHWSAEGLEVLPVQLDQAAVDAIAHASAADALLVVQGSETEDQGTASVIRLGDQGLFRVRLSYTDRDSVRTADISADGNRVVTGSYRGRLTLWNTSAQVAAGLNESVSERELLTLFQFQSAVQLARFSEDQSQLTAFETSAAEGNGVVLPTSN